MLTAFLIILTFYVTRVVYTRQIIRDNDGSPYLIRYFLFKSYWLQDKGFNVGRIYLHNIVRSDYDRALHDHPWNFVSLMLKGSYREWADFRAVMNVNDAEGWKIPNDDKGTNFWPLTYQDFKAPCLLRRGAGWRHRLELDKPVWTLVFVSGKARTWGFWTNLGTAIEKFCAWNKYDTHKGICEDEQ